MKPTADKDSVIARPALLRRTLADLDEADFDTAPIVILQTLPDKICL
jgi:hypothetical protein